MPRTKPDPKLVALQDQLARAQADAERWYGRLERAFGRLEKARRAAAIIRGDARHGARARFGLRRGRASG
jgi:hypothetical protein